MHCVVDGCCPDVGECGIPDVRVGEAHGNGNGNPGNGGHGGHGGGHGRPGAASGLGDLARAGMGFAVGVGALVSIVAMFLG